MDLLFYDVATQNINTMFISTSNRAYRGNRIGGSNATLGGMTNFYWGNKQEIRPGIMYGTMTTERYTVPEVLADIGRDTAAVLIKQSNSIDLSELSVEGYYGEDDRSMMMQWCLGGFSNPEVVRNSLALVRKNRMFSNEFVADFKILDFTLFRLFHLEPLLTHIIDPQENGVAMQRANTYTYKTRDYSLYTTQNYHPGTYGDQQHVAGMNISNKFSIFHSHPAVEKDVNKQSPNYWVGYGHIPHTVQDSNIALAIYDIPARKGVMEADLLDYTHAYFPREKFDMVVMEDQYAFGMRDDTYCAFIAANPLAFRGNTADDLIQPGKKVFWITEAGSRSEDGSFEDFSIRIKSNPVSFDQENLSLKYQSGGQEYRLQYKGAFSINRQDVNVDYKRFDSKYCVATRKPETVTIRHNGKSLFLDFYNMIREF
jgi:hypothetical protein